MQSFKNYAWLEHFWDSMIFEQEGSRWEVHTSFDGDIALRDSRAHALIRGRLSNRSDVDYRFDQAWGGNDEPLFLGEGVNLIQVGRPKPFLGSCISPWAGYLERRAYGRFLDPTNGQTGDTIRYTAGGCNYLFTRRQVEGSVGPHNRCDLDYGILLCRRDDGSGGHFLVSIGGLSSLGTLGLMAILTHDLHRRKLRDQLREFAHWRPGHRPDRAVELVVRIDAGGEEGLSRILNGLERKDGTLPFDFQAVVAAMETEEPGWAVYVRAPKCLDVQLLPPENGRKSGRLRLGSTGPSCRLAGKRFQFMKLLVEEPERATFEYLCERLGYYDPAQGEVSLDDRKPLHKLVTDTNKVLRAFGLVGSGGNRPVRYERKLGRYIFEIAPSMPLKRAA